LLTSKCHSRYTVARSKHPLVSGGKPGQSSLRLSQDEMTINLCRKSFSFAKSQYKYIDRCAK
jgi:hypothetical protein